VYISVRYIWNEFVFMYMYRAFTALTAAVAGSVVLFAGLLVARTTDT